MALRRFAYVCGALVCLISLVVAFVFSIEDLDIDLETEVKNFFRNIASESNRTVFDVNDFPWTHDLRAGVDVMLEEFMRYERWLPPFTGDPELGRIHNADKKWHTLWLRAYGRDLALSRDFPKTRQLLQATGFSSAMFSVLEAKKTLKLHEGDFGGVLRYQLALRVPSGSETCAIDVYPHGFDPYSNYSIRLDDPISPATRLSFEPGKDHIFDDTAWHRSMNLRSGRRINLFLDIPRPDLPWWGAIANHILLFYIFPYHPRVRLIADTADAHVAKKMKEENMLGTQ